MNCNDVTLWGEVGHKPCMWGKVGYSGERKELEGVPEPSGRDGVRREGQNPGGGG